VTDIRPEDSFIDPRRRNNAKTGDGDFIHKLPLVFF
jgi:hypothetical protein